MSRIQFVFFLLLQVPGTVDTDYSVWRIGDPIETRKYAQKLFFLLGQSGTRVVLAPSAFVRRSPPSGPVSLFLLFVQHSSPCVSRAGYSIVYRNAVVLHLSAANRVVSAFPPGRRRHRRRHSSKTPYTRAGHVRVAPDPALLLDPASARAPGNAFPNIKRTRR